MRLEIGADQRALVSLPALATAGCGNVGADMVALVDRIENVGNVRLDRFRRDAVALLYSSCLARRRSVSSIARSIEPVILSA
jgi:hypothetical protein